MQLNYLSFFDGISKQMHVTGYATKMAGNQNAIHT